MTHQSYEYQVIDGQATQEAGASADMVFTPKIFRPRRQTG